MKKIRSEIKRINISRRNKPRIVPITIVVPTLNEAGNIPVLAERIHTSLSAAKIPYDIIIVDDNSSDRTPQTVKRIAERFNITLIIRKNERGLSSAVIAGIRAAKGVIIVVMDADLSHSPEKIAELVRQITDHGADFVIGSRFVPGGSAVSFNWFRKLNAFISRMLARPFANVADPMSGFFAFRRSLAENLEILNPLGFKIGLEILVKYNPGNIAEIPIDFQERLYGESKLSFREQVAYLRHLFRLAKYKYSIFRKHR